MNQKKFNDSSLKAKLRKHTILAILYSYNLYNS